MLNLYIKRRFKVAKIRFRNEITSRPVLHTVREIKWEQLILTEISKIPLESFNNGGKSACYVTVLRISTQNILSVDATNG